MRTVIVPTDLAIAYLVREGVTQAQARNAIYRWSKMGLLTNHGGACRNQALWDLAEINALHDAGIWRSEGEDH